MIATNRELRRSPCSRGFRMWHILLLQCLMASTQDGSRFFAKAFSMGFPSRRTLYQNVFPLAGRKGIQRGSSTSLYASTYDGKGTKTKVPYQKVIRPPPNLPDILFLGYLVEYLESHFEIPNGLPMIYEIQRPRQESDQYIIAVDSPLSPASDVTRMEIEVIGIYTAKNENDKKVPNIAMVVVKKEKNPQSSLPTMMANLFEDSEKKILKALDRGLEKFVQGKIKFKDADQVKKKKIPNLRTAEQVIEAELMDELPISKSTKTAAEDVVVEAYATSDDNDNSSNAKSKPNPDIKQKKVELEAPKATKTQNDATVEAKVATNELETKKSPPSEPITTEDDTNPAGLDFAVRAAKQAAAKRKARLEAKEDASSSEPEEDYAVAAARKAAAAKQPPPEDYAIAAARKAAALKEKSKPKAVEPKKVTPKTKTTVKGETQPQMGQPMSMPEMGGSSPPPAFSSLNESRSFGFTISRPGDRAKKARKTTVAQVKKGSISKGIVTPSAATPKAEKTSAVSPKVENKMKSDEPSATVDTFSKQEMNGTAATSPGSATKAGSDEPSTTMDSTSKKEPVMNGTAIPGTDSEQKKTAKDNKTKSKPMPSQEQMELDVMKAAKEVIEEMAEGSEDMTAEELLRDVLKFDEEEKQKTAPGGGFVSGAFEKAKQILQEQYRQRQTRTFDGSKPNIKDPNQFPVDAGIPLSEEEELKRMFQAGEQIADTRITKKVTENFNLQYGRSSAEDEVEELIANEKSVSSYAKVLDDELVELELQINPTPGEELDGPMRNPMFDIMSGPEVYNPNTEMDAVNYPGALPGTKEVRLPKQLEEAKKQAEFAINVLKKLRTVETKDDNGEVIKTQYFVGEREMTVGQVNDLQTVVAEASQIGIITDPVTLIQESSRLQLLIDELWNQPRERFRDIAENYKDLILSENFVSLVKERMANMVERDLDALRRDDESLKEGHEREREILGQVVEYAQFLLKEVRALGAELEAQQLEVVRSICKVAMDPRHTTEEETAMALTDAVRDMRPLLDDMFVAYLKYAVAEEKGRLARAGLLDDPEHNQWLFVLQIVQQGVYKEIAVGVNRYIDHIGYVIRMKTPQQRRKLVEKLIDVMPSMDVRPFVQVVENIVGALGDGTKGDFDGIDTLGEWTNELLQLHRDVKELLPPERIALKARDADEWAERQRQRLLESRKVSVQRLQAEKDNAHRQDEIEALGRRGEIERIE